MLNTFNGTPLIGYCQLTNAAPGPTALTLTTQMGGASYTLGAGERLYITNVTWSSSDTTAAIVTLDTGGTTPTNISRIYLSATQPVQPEKIPPGITRCIPGVTPRASATAVTSGKTVELVVKAYLSKT